MVGTAGQSHSWLAGCHWLIGWMGSSGDATHPLSSIPWPGLSGGGVEGRTEVRFDGLWCMAKLTCSLEDRRVAHATMI